MAKTTPKSCPSYPSHGAQVGRLNRAIGQLEGSKKMIDERRYCPEIIAVLRGARAAIKAVEANILETYLGSCVADSFSKGSDEDRAQKLAELKDLFKKLG